MTVMQRSGQATREKDLESLPLESLPLETLHSIVLVADGDAAGRVTAEPEQGIKSIRTKRMP
jgi:hypothetical protein